MNYPNQTEPRVSGCISVEVKKSSNATNKGDFNNPHYPPNHRQY